MGPSQRVHRDAIVRQVGLVVSMSRCTAHGQIRSCQYLRFPQWRPGCAPSVEGEPNGDPTLKDPLIFLGPSAKHGATIVNYLGDRFCHYDGF